MTEPSDAAAVAALMARATTQVKHLEQYFKDGWERPDLRNVHGLLSGLLALVEQLSAEVQALIADRDRLQQHLERLGHAHDEAFTRAEAAEASRDRLQGYAQHKDGCDSVPHRESGSLRGTGRCSCGLSALLAGEPEQ